MDLKTDTLKSFSSILECVNSSSCTEQDLLRKITDLIMKESPCRTCAYVFVDFNTESLQIRYSRGLSSHAIKEFYKNIKSPTVAKILWKCEGPVEFNDAGADSAVSQDLRIGDPFMHAAVAPIKSMERTIGYIQCERAKQEPPFSEQDLLRIGIAAMIISFAMEYVRISSYCRDLTTTDHLTGLLKYDIFLSKLQREIEYVHREIAPLALVLMDVDNFTQYIQNNGIERANTALRTIGTILQTSLRNIDIIGRYGADEFIIVLVNNKPSVAKKVLDRVIKKIQASKDLSWMTFSAGIIGLEAKDKSKHSMKTILSNLRAAMYESKIRGGDCVCVKEIE